MSCSQVHYYAALSTSSKCRERQKHSGRCKWNQNYKGDNLIESWWQMQYQDSNAQFRFILQFAKTNIIHPRSARVGWKMDSARRILSTLPGWKRTAWRAVAFVVRINLSFIDFALTSLLPWYLYMRWRLWRSQSLNKYTVYRYSTRDVRVVLVRFTRAIHRYIKRNRSSTTLTICAPWKGRPCATSHAICSHTCCISPSKSQRAKAKRTTHTIGDTW